MKKFIVLMIFAIGMFAMLPSTSSGSAPPGQSSFIVDQSADLTAMVADALAEPRLIASLQANVSAITLPICREGGGVVILEDIFADQRHLNLFDKPVRTKVKFTWYCINDFRSRLTNEKVQNQTIKINNVAAHRFARDGLKQVKCSEGFIG